jgi:hypothetical protein
MAMDTFIVVAASYNTLGTTERKGVGKEIEAAVQ